MSGVKVRISNQKRTVDDKTDKKESNSGKMESNSGNAANLSENAKEMLKNLKKINTSEKFYEIEDNTALALGHSTILERFLFESAVLKKAIHDYTNGTPVEVNINARIARLRRLARLSHYATAQLRKEASEKLEVVDAKLLQLQNSTSEVNHIQKEIDRCLDYSAGDEDLELVALDEFYEKAPELVADTEVLKNDEHQEYLARLKFEVEQRKQLQSTLQELEGRRNVLASDIRGKELRLQSLKPKIDDLVKAAEPVQEALGAKYKNVKVESQQRNLSLSLPPSLAVVHVHSLAYKELFDDKNFDIRIIEIPERTKDEEVDVKRSRNDEDSVRDKIEQLREKIFDVDSMSLEITVGCPESGIAVKMLVRYLTELKVCSLRWLIDGLPKSGSSSILDESLFMAELFPLDNGDKCPNSVGEIKLNELGLNFISASKTIGKPYKFINSFIEINGVDKTEKMKELVKLIRKRVVNRICLWELVHELESNNKNLLENENNVKLVSFKYYEEEKLMASITPSLASKVSGEQFGYRAEFQNDDGIKTLGVFMLIPVDYPQSNVIFGFDTDQSNVESVQLFEKKLNPTDEIDLKSQLSLLVKNFDIILF